MKRGTDAIEVSRARVVEQSGQVPTDGLECPAFEKDAYRKIRHKKRGHKHSHRRRTYLQASKLHPGDEKIQEGGSSSRRQRRIGKEESSRRKRRRDHKAKSHSTPHHSRAPRPIKI